MNDQSALPYQTHSETSRIAARENTTAGTYREKVFNLIKNSQFIGKIADEIAEEMDYIPNIISTRLGELEAAGRIKKLEDHRKTRNNRPANIYVLPEYVGGRKVLPPKKSNQAIMKQLRADREKLMRATTTAIFYIKQGRNGDARQFLEKTLGEINE